MLLASDLDGTLIASEQTKESSEESAEFLAYCEKQNGLELAYVTGRHLTLGISGVVDSGLPLPKVFVCDVGTSMYNREGDSWQLSGDYENAFAGDWAGLDSEDLSRLLDGVCSLKKQEPERQSRFKISYYIREKSSAAHVLEEVSARLKDASVKANLIYSVDPKLEIGLLDVLPESASKRTAVEHLRKKFGLSKDDVVYAGDSGNDIQAFLGGYKSILVANTPQDVKDYVREQSQKLGISTRIYYSSRECTAGVLEGLRHFGVCTA